MSGAGDAVEILPVEEAVARGGVTEIEEGARDSTDELRHYLSSKFASLRDEIHKEITSRDVMLQKLEESVTRLTEDIAPVKDYVTAEMEEEDDEASSQSSGSSEGAITLDIITELCHQQSSDFASLRGEITSRDILLRKLEESVTRLSEDIAPLKDYVTAKMQEEGHSALSQSSGSPEGGAPQDGDQETEAERNNRVQNRCVDVMMSLKEIRENNEAKTQKVRGFYERIYKASPITSLMLKFLEIIRGVKVHIDCDSANISNFVRGLANLDGEKCAGTALHTFADFFECKIYLGGKAEKSQVCDCSTGLYVYKNHVPEVSLSQSLAQMVMYLIFKNRGFPYKPDDDMNEKVFEEIAREALQKKKTSGQELEELINDALSMKTPLGREVSLISVVPGMLVKYGSQGGMSKLRQQVLFLTYFFMQQVIPKMRSIIN